MAGREDDDSDVPEEFTVEQGLHQDEEIRKIQRENKARVIQERKERHRKRAQKTASQQSHREEAVEDVSQNEAVDDVSQNEPDIERGMLPNNIVDLLAAKEKQVFDSDEEIEEKEHKPKKKRPAGKYGIQPVILKDLPPAHCVKNSLEFLKRRKMQVPRSSAVLNNSNQPLRFLSRSGLLK